jgi:hypothetical protein
LLGIIRITNLNKFRLVGTKLNDRPTDIPFGEAGDDMSLPRNETNDTAPQRVACQSLKAKTAHKIVI